MQRANDATLSAAVKKNPRDVKVINAPRLQLLTRCQRTVHCRWSNFPRPLILESEQLSRK